jgi:hypothetical protein
MVYPSSDHLMYPSEIVQSLIRFPNDLRCTAHVNGVAYSNVMDPLAFRPADPEGLVQHHLRLVEKLSLAPIDVQS